jgi:hypothetical protein
MILTPVGTGLVHAAAVAWSGAKAFPEHLDAGCGGPRRGKSTDELMMRGSFAGRGSLRPDRCSPWHRKPRHQRL